MFKCQRCQKVSDPGDQPVRVVVEYRRREGGYGSEIAREESLCPACAEKAREAVSPQTIMEAAFRQDRKRARMEAKRKRPDFEEDDYE